MTVTTQGNAMLRIVPTIDNIGYWITVGGHSDYNENLQLGLESISDHFSKRISFLQEEIRKLESLKSETDSELEKRGGKYRPRRVAMPPSDVWWADCKTCKASNSTLNMVAIEVTIGGIKVLCRECCKEQFPSLVR